MEFSINDAKRLDDERVRREREEDEKRIRMVAADMLSRVPANPKRSRKEDLINALKNALRYGTGPIPAPAG